METENIRALEEVSSFGKVLGEFKTQCPFCGGPLTIREVEYDVPKIGKVLIVNRMCLKCGYKKNEIVPLVYRRRTRVYFRVEQPEDFEVKVVRSPTARVLVPELGLELEPGIDAEMFVTNTEGVLQLFLDALERIKVLDPQVNASTAEEELKDIITQRRGGFTVILDDESGVSTFYREDAQDIFLLIEEVE